MNNPGLIVPINNKVQLSSSANVPLGSGIKIFSVNPEPKAEIKTCDSYLTTTAAKYCTESTGAQIALNAFCVLTNLTAKQWEVFATAGVVLTVRIVGVSALNNEQQEDIVCAGTTPVLSTLNYKFVNDIYVVSGGNLTAAQVVTVRPSGGTPQDQRITLSALYKFTWGFMACNKNGKTRKARLRSVNSLNNTVASSNFSLHIFQNNVTTGSNLGVYRPALRIYDATTTTLQGLLFSDDGPVELEAGELAVFFRESTTTAVTGISFTFSLYYV